MKELPPPVVLIQDEDDPKRVYLGLHAKDLKMVAVPQLGNESYICRSVTRSELTDTAYQALVAAGACVPDHPRGE